MVDPIQKQVQKKNEEMGKPRKGEKTEFEGRNKKRKNKEVKRTYRMPFSSPPPCSTWKDRS